MKESNNKQYIDGICLTCRNTNPKHDIKISIIQDTFLEIVRIDLISIDFLLFECFLKQFNANKAFIEYKEFTKYIKVINLSYANISKFYSHNRNKIRIEMHKELNKSKLGLNISEGGVPRIEIDENKIIGNTNKIF